MAAALLVRTSAAPKLPDPAVRFKLLALAAALARPKLSGPVVANALSAPAATVIPLPSVIVPAPVTRLPAASV